MSPRAIDVLGVPYNSSGTTSGVARGTVAPNAGRGCIMVPGRIGWWSGDDRGGRPVEMAVSIALIVIAVLEITWIVRTVQANLPRV